VNVYTARISTRDVDAVDISRAGCDRLRKAKKPAPGEFLAPSAALVFPVLRAMKAATTDAEREQVWTDYATLYRLEMLASHKARRPEWEALLRRERAVLCCYCAPLTGVLRCHRVLAAGYLARLGATYCGEVNA